MSQATAQRINYRIAAEALLLSEEKWIVEALKKIKTQRNCLQIERLQLESMKAKLKINERDPMEEDATLPNPPGEMRPPPNPQIPYEFTTTEPTPTTSTVNLMQNHGKITSSQIIEFETNLMEVEAFCNAEALNLDVTNPVFSHNVNGGYNVAENEEEEDDEELDVNIDMDMLMNGANEDD